MAIIPHLIAEDRLFSEFRDCLKWLTTEAGNGTTDEARHATGGAV